MYLTDAVELTWSLLLAAPAASKLAAAVTPASSVAIVCFPKSPLFVDGVQHRRCSRVNGEGNFLGWVLTVSVAASGEICLTSCGSAWCGACPLDVALWFVAAKICVYEPTERGFSVYMQELVSVTMPPQPVATQSCPPEHSRRAAAVERRFILRRAKKLLHNIGQTSTCSDSSKITRLRPCPQQQHSNSSCSNERRRSNPIHTFSVRGWGAQVLVLEPVVHRHRRETDSKNMCRCLHPSFNKLPPFSPSHPCR